MLLGHCALLRRPTGPVTVPQQETTTTKMCHSVELEVRTHLERASITSSKYSKRGTNLTCFFTVEQHTSIPKNLYKNPSRSKMRTQNKTRFMNERVLNFLLKKITLTRSICIWIMASNGSPESWRQVCPDRNSGPIYFCPDCTWHISQNSLAMRHIVLQYPVRSCIQRVILFQTPQVIAVRLCCHWHTIIDARAWLGRNRTMKKTKANDKFRSPY